MLAGGRSTRFGSADKLRAELAGEPVLHHAIRRLASVSDSIVVVTGAAGVPPMPPDIVVVTARDAAEGEGPLVGAMAGLETADADTVLVVGGDMPALVPDVLLELVRLAMEPPNEAAALSDGERIRPLPVALRREPALGAARSLVAGGERRLRALLEALQTAAVEPENWRALDPGGRTLVDVDVPADLSRAQP